MAMHKITGSHLVQPHYLDKFSKNAEPSTAATPERPGTANADPAERTADRAVISEHARRLEALQQALDAGRAALARPADPRDEKLNQVRTRLAAGYYDSPLVADQVAAKVVNVFDGMDAL